MTKICQVLVIWGMSLAATLAADPVAPPAAPPAVPAAAASVPTGSPASAPDGPLAKGPRFAKEIAAFEKADADHPPAPGGVLFVGSSSIRLWDLEVSFPGRNYLNRGFGGSTMGELLHYTDRIVLPYRPKVIVLYEGDNDIKLKVTPAAYAEHFKQFVGKVRQQLPTTRILVLGIKPSRSRWELWPTMQEANRLVAELAATDPLITVLDTATPLLGEDGLPIPELYKQDALHLSPAGYARWAKVLEPHLAAGTP